MVKNTDLLKLSDYPFSYSLIGGLFLILAGKSVTFSEIFTAQFGPILAIMGLVGTGLAISDPFGRLLKMIGMLLTKRELPKSYVEKKLLELQDYLERAEVEDRGPLRSLGMNVLVNESPGYFSY